MNRAGENRLGALVAAANAQLESLSFPGTGVAEFEDRNVVRSRQVGAVKSMAKATAGTPEDRACVRQKIVRSRDSFRTIEIGIAQAVRCQPKDDADVQLCSGEVPRRPPL